MTDLFFNQSFPNTRLRRLRQNASIRALVEECSIEPKHLIQPVFVCEGKGKQIAIDSMPDIFRYSIDKLIDYVHDLISVGINAIALFPVIDSAKKNLAGTEAFNKNGLAPTAIKTLKKKFPKLLIIADVALDPYTSHGQDGIVDKSGYILNDKTVAALTKQALVLATAGADIIAPSDMMDGRIGAIRESLESHNFTNTLILSYAAKYASAFYGPFRDAVGSKNNLGKADKKNYQMDPKNSDEALREVALDLAEGADMVMVKPGLPYLDIIRRVHDTFKVPTLAYHVSGEYSMLKATAAKGWIEEEACVLESLISLRRAGACGILTYYAHNAAKWLKK